MAKGDPLCDSDRQGGKPLGARLPRFVVRYLLAPEFILFVAMTCGLPVSQVDPDSSGAFAFIVAEWLVGSWLLLLLSKHVRPRGAEPARFEMLWRVVSAMGAVAMAVLVVARLC